MPSNDADGNLPTDNLDDHSIFRRPVRTYVIRMGRMTENEKRSYEELHHVWCIPFEHRTLNFTDVFNNTNPVTMEIGFGMGHATAQIAQENPGMNYIGSEVHIPGVGRLLGEIKKRQLKNLYLIEYDALEILETMIPDNSLAGFHIFFPDPWPKKKHHKRRLLQRPRTDLLVAKLAPGGYIYFATDWEEYALSALDELSCTEGISNRYERFAPHQEWRPRTKFEQKGIDAGREIFELFFVKDGE
ncbi:tRNA (guanosine(46)-N7)-methyltransferase TrmB [Treponema sp.]|uniref:tRNA (guanosine(46)-N7)-methyltransferase TrmB n=1 Tax=Treponema sp. TaxID=166 RepID=UPI003F007519